jgi:hypothetical protein
MYNNRITEVHQNVKFLSFRVTTFMANNFSPIRGFCVRNGSVTPREEGFAKQTQVMLLGQWLVEDVV